MGLRGVFSGFWGRRIIKDYWAFARAAAVCCTPKPKSYSQAPPRRLSEFSWGRTKRGGVPLQSCMAPYLQERGFWGFAEFRNVRPRIVQDATYSHMHWISFASPMKYTRQTVPSRPFKSTLNPKPLKPYTPKALNPSFKVCNRKEKTTRGNFRTAACHATREALLT